MVHFRLIDLTSCNSRAFNFNLKKKEKCTVAKKSSSLFVVPLGIWNVRSQCTSNEGGAFRMCGQRANENNDKR